MIESRCDQDSCGFCSSWPFRLTTLVSSLCSTPSPGSEPLLCLLPTCSFDYRKEPLPAKGLRRARQQLRAEQPLPLRAQQPLPAQVTLRGGYPCCFESGSYFLFCRMSGSPCGGSETFGLGSVCHQTLMRSH